MQTHIDNSTDGRRLLHVLFERQSPDADVPTIEVIFFLQWPDDYQITDPVSVLVPLSCTRTDTREAITLTTEEDRAVLQEAANAATLADQGD